MRLHPHKRDDTDVRVQKVTAAPSASLHLYSDNKHPPHSVPLKQIQDQTLIQVKVEKNTHPQSSAPLTLHPCFREKTFSTTPPFSLNLRVFPHFLTDVSQCRWWTNSAHLSDIKLLVKQLCYHGNCFWCLPLPHKPSADTGEPSPPRLIRSITTSSPCPSNFQFSSPWSQMAVMSHVTGFTVRRHWLTSSDWSVTQILSVFCSFSRRNSLMPQSSLSNLLWHVYFHVL